MKYKVKKLNHFSRRWKLEVGSWKSAVEVGCHFSATVHMPTSELSHFAGIPANQSDCRSAPTSRTSKFLLLRARSVTINLEPRVQAMSLLGYTWYYYTVKAEQEEAITHFALGRDVFVSLPTGYGNSFCYQALPLVFDCLRKVEKSIVMEVSLLVALMKDQVASCSSREFNFKFRLTRNQDRVYRPFPSAKPFQLQSLAHTKFYETS